MKLKPLLPPERDPRKRSNDNYNERAKEDGEVEVELDKGKVLFALHNLKLEGYMKIRIAEILNDHLGEILVRKR